MACATWKPASKAAPDVQHTRELRALGDSLSRLPAWAAAEALLKLLRKAAHRRVLSGILGNGTTVESGPRASRRCSWSVRRRDRRRHTIAAHDACSMIPRTARRPQGCNSDDQAKERPRTGLFAEKSDQSRVRILPRSRNEQKPGARRSAAQTMTGATIRETGDQEYEEKVLTAASASGRARRAFEAPRAERGRASRDGRRARRVATIAGSRRLRNDGEEEQYSRPELHETSLEDRRRASSVVEG